MDRRQLLFVFRIDEGGLVAGRNAVVVSAFVVHPTMPSEPGIGWQFLLATLEHAQAVDAVVVLLTNRRSEIACRGQVPARFASRLEVVAIDIPRAPSFFRWHEPRFTRIEHEIWVNLAGRRMPSLARRYNVVYTHHVVFATELLSTPITRLPADVFKVWGPIGAGGVAAVFRIRPRTATSLRQFCMQALRDLLIALPARRTASGCDLVLAQNEAVVDVLGSTGAPTRIFPNVVVPRSAESSRSVDHRAGLDILCVGHLIARKRIDIAIDALLAPALASATLHIVGQTSTPHAAALRAQCERTGVLDRVVFHGGIEHSEVLAMMAGMSVLLHPSGREGASGVVGEATSQGLPVVCFAGTGAASVLQYAGTSGIALPARAGTNREEIAAAVVDAAAMPRCESAVWSTSRFVDLAAQLWGEGIEHRSTRRVGVS